MTNIRTLPLARTATAENAALLTRVAAVALLLSVGLSAHAATLTVTSDADDGRGTLRRAILFAAPDDTIVFAPDVTSITLTSGRLLIDKNLTIAGPGADFLTISGA